MMTKLQIHKGSRPTDEMQCQGRDFLSVNGIELYQHKTSLPPGENLTEESDGDCFVGTFFGNAGEVA